MAIEIRSGQDQEWTLAAELRQQMSVDMGNDYDRDFAGWRERFTDSFRRKARTGIAHLLLAMDGDRAAGMAIVSIDGDYRYEVFGRRIARINGTFVQRDYRRQGIAEGLVLSAIAWSRANECTAVRLRTSDQGRPLYAKLGFVATDEMELQL